MFVVKAILGRLSCLQPPNFGAVCGREKSGFVLPAKLQCGQSRQKRFLDLARVLSRPGPESVMTTFSATVQCGAHGNSAFKEWWKANGMERKRCEVSGNYTKRSCGQKAGPERGKDVSISNRLTGHG